MVSACHQIIRSASARSPATSYSPRTTTPSVSTSLSSAAASAATFSRSSPSGWTEANTDHIAYRIESLISRTTDGAGLRVAWSLMPSLWLAQDGEHLAGCPTARPDARRYADALVGGSGDSQCRLVGDRRRGRPVCE